MTRRSGSPHPFGALAMVASIASLLLACPGAPPQPPPPNAIVVEPNVDRPSAPPPVSSDASSAAPPSAPASTACTRDDDCVVSTFPGCCACCKCGPIRAFTRDAEAERKEACGRKTCDECPSAAAGTCAPCKDPAKEGMAARCQSGACVIVETAVARVACKTTDDCWFDDARKPIARPASMRGRKITPCKGGNEHAPACQDGTCVVRAFKC